MNRKFFIMALVRGIFGYFPCGLGVAIIAMAFSINSLRSFFIGATIFLIGALVLYFTRRYESSDWLL
ncbi:hypothetical protein [Paenibacillus polymyxa]|uniref:Urease accessory protein UreH-like transmembrane domain-containing protein n=1 Tax=Paenibacillus polymyxa TaxID=1406 RepID=A0A378XVS2_PAEPO|nr:hypothetical protein [Paenibacillus polymyxa]KAE8558576.1 hypothetical protein BJH92_19065 [Paenibacillus polymyxa]MBE7897075.1 hypothetical protein [Paenibacillus polymyxa]MBG9762935.1 hypothetical protein [Paenibacillus polymyxa]MCC3257678.1 hypothetical protein [Paenibacillus polymyxa]MCJ1218775.1 hypothetical protein [Paenibacillus polymyxa]